MKYILRNTDGELGLFDTAVEQADGFLCDGNLFVQFTIFPNAQIVEVADDYQTPAMIAAAQKAKEEFNAGQAKQRHAAYVTDSDPIFFKSQRGEATHQEWLDAVAAVDARYPYEA